MSDREVAEPPIIEKQIAIQPALTEGAQPVKALPGIQWPTGLNLSLKIKNESWKAYKQQWQNYQIVTQLNRQAEEYGIALFLYSIGPQTVKTYISFHLSENEQNLDAIIAALDWYAIGETNETFEGYLFCYNMHVISTNDQLD